jgi:hypothetical protein
MHLAGFETATPETEKQLIYALHRDRFLRTLLKVRYAYTRMYTRTQYIRAFFVINTTLPTFRYLSHSAFLIGRINAGNQYSRKY